jgi:hypothetical protein
MCSWKKTEARRGAANAAMGLLQHLGSGQCPRKGPSKSTRVMDPHAPANQSRQSLLLEGVCHLPPFGQPQAAHFFCIIQV